jgi:hypothetical protein
MMRMNNREHSLHFEPHVDRTCYYQRTTNPIKTDGRNHHVKDKREGQRKVKRCPTLKNQRRERNNPSGSYLIDNPSNIVSMQIVRSNSNRRFRTNIS